MPINHAWEEKQLRYIKKLTLSNNRKFVRSGRKVFQQKTENDVWQPIFDQPLQANPYL